MMTVLDRESAWDRPRQMAPNVCSWERAASGSVTISGRAWTLASAANQHRAPLYA